MTYLITQMLLCLLVAFALGFFLGWLLRGVGCRERIAALEVRLTDLVARASTAESRAREAEAAAEAARAKAAAEADNAAAAQAVAAVEAEMAADATAAAVAIAAAAAEADEPYIPGYPVEEIEGIGEGFGKRLRAEGVPTTDRLLVETRTAEGRAFLAQVCEVDEATVGNWRTMADLLRIPGIGGQWAEILWRCGVTDVSTLAGQDAAGLLARMEEVNAAEHRVPVELPTVQRVSHWIEEAAAAGAGAAAASGEPRDLYVPGHPVEEIEGIGPGFGRRLRADGIATTGRLLLDGLTPEGRATIAGICEVDEDTAHNWVTMADLLRLPGVGGQWAELLWRSGIGNVQTLARQEASALLARMERINTDEHRVPEMPTLERVAHWIEEAGRVRPLLD